MAALKSKFHNIVSQGPLHNCSCCEQPWYKNSAFPVAKLRDSDHDAEKYLLKTKCLNNQKCLCRTRHNYLAKNKVPRQNQPSAFIDIPKIIQHKFPQSESSHNFRYG